MNYYQHHIGDFDKSTRHLTRVERSLYRDLIELYYDTEKPIDIDLERVSRKVMANSEEEKKAFYSVIDEFFEKKEDGYHNHRCDYEIEKYHSNSKAKSKAGKISAAKRAAKREQNSTRVEQVSNEIQLTNNHKPITNNQDKRTSKKNFSDDDIKTSEFLYSRILKNNPSHKKPNIETWANDVRLMREVDNKNHHEICELFDWASKHHFWYKNILSPATLRKQWDKLIIERSSENDRRPKQKFDAADYFIDKVRADYK